MKKMSFFDRCSFAFDLTSINVSAFFLKTQESRMATLEKKRRREGYYAAQASDELKEKKKKKKKVKHMKEGEDEKIYQKVQMLYCTTM